MKKPDISRQARPGIRICGRKAENCSRKQRGTRGRLTFVLKM